MRTDQAARLAIGSRERWETGLTVVERTGVPFAASPLPYANSAARFN